MIDINIFNVDRGFCALVDTKDNHNILIDCGSGNQFKPSEFIGKKHSNILDYLVLPAYTQDHLSGFPEVMNQSLVHDIPIHFLISNPTVNSDKFTELKPYSSSRINSLLTANNTFQKVAIDELKLTFFWNEYSDFQAPHNLSLVTFVQYRDINLILPSDLEVDGWQKLLQSREFQQQLQRVNIFVAANHGQENGYCTEVFRYCNPEIIIISNKENKPISSRMMYEYYGHAKGALSGVSDKKVLTTYEDGTITISKYLDSLRQITTERKSRPYVYLN